MIEYKISFKERRWFYLLWSGLLSVVLVVWVMWLLPGRSGHGKMDVRVRVNGAPKGMVVQIWSGPSSFLRKRKRVYGVAIVPGQDGWTNMPTQTIPFAQRRWLELMHPSTADQVVLRFRVPSGEMKYVWIDLQGDFYHGFLRENRTLGYEIQIDWSGITGADGSPTRIL